MAEIEGLPNARVQIGEALARTMKADGDFLFDTLRTIESVDVATGEINKSIRALETYERELQHLDGRRPFGKVSVSLPFNNPLYSLILYAFGPAVGGSEITVRPSSITDIQVRQIYDRYQDYFAAASIRLFDGRGADFVNKAISDDTIQSLLFTGSWNNLQRILPSYPTDKRLIYCGSGINPFIIADDPDRSTQEWKGLIDLAADSRLYNSGQDCLCAERFYVHRDLHSTFLHDLAERLDQIRCGPVSDPSADITPVLGLFADNIRGLLAEAPAPIYGKAPEDNLVQPIVLDLPLESRLLTVEKFAPVFTVAAYDTIQDLERHFDTGFRFGATVCGDVELSSLDAFPHVTRHESVITLESQDAHEPFGGREKSGFTRRGNLRKDGPILYSIETTEADSDN